MVELDHVILAVPALDVALEKLGRDYGLRGVPVSGSDGPIQTAIIPFENDQYLEVLALKEPKPASGPLADLAKRLTDQGAFFWGFAVRTAEIESVAKRVGLAATAFAGKTVQSKTIRPPPNESEQIPFFIEYQNGTGKAYLDSLRAELPEAEISPRFSRIVVSTDRQKLQAWLGMELAEIEVVEAGDGVDGVNGTAGIVSVEIETPGGRFEILADR